MKVEENYHVSQLSATLIAVTVPGFSLHAHSFFFKFSLSDSSTLREYQIVEGSKLHLSIRKASDEASSANPNDFFGLLRDFLKGHFSEQDTERVMLKFREVC